MKHIKPYNEMLKYKNVKMIDMNDWDNLVSKTYGKPYAFQQQDGCKERGTHTFTVPSKYADDYENDTIEEVINGEEMGVSFKAWLARDPKAPVGNETDQWTIDLFWERNFYPNFDVLVNDLHEKGLLEAGQYTIDIDW